MNGDWWSLNLRIGDETTMSEFTDYSNTSLVENHFKTFLAPKQVTLSKIEGKRGN
jgi:hypothetical protein